MKIRPATPNDFTALMNIATATNSIDSLWNLLLPRAAFKEVAFKEHVSALLKQYLDQANKDWLISVVELPEKDVTPGASSVASFAIWDMATVNGKSKAKGAPESAGTAEAASESSSRYLTRFNKFNAALAEGRENNLKGFSKFMHLRLLATHPEYKDEGYAKALLRAGYEIARKTDAAVTVFAGPQGYVFFSGLGFSDRGPVPVAGAGEEVVIKAMSFDPTTERRRSSVMESFKNYLTN